MMKLFLNGREVDVLEVSHGREPEDTRIDDAIWVDTEVPLTSAELDALTEENADLMYEEFINNRLVEADFLMDMEKEELM